MISCSLEGACPLSFFACYPEARGERAPAPHIPAHWGTARDSEHCRSEKGTEIKKNIHENHFGLFKYVQDPPIWYLAQDF